MAYVDEVLADSPTSYWRLGEKQGTVADDAVAANDGTYLNAPLLGVPHPPDLADSAVRLASASSEEVTLPGPVLTTNAAIELWFKWTAGTALLRDHTSTSQAWIIGFDNAGTFAIRIGTVSKNTSLSTAAARDGQWHHLVVNKTGGTVVVYVDNVEILNSGSAILNTASAMPWHLGRNGSGGAFSDVALRRVAMYPAALSTTRIGVHFNAGSQGTAGSGAPIRSHALDAAWSFFNDPHVVAQRTPGGVNWLHTGYVNSAGDAAVTSRNLDTGAVVSSVLHAALEIDDHDPVSLLVMPDGTLFACYSMHGNSGLWYRRTTDPEDPTSWGTEVNITAATLSLTNTTYPKPFRFASGRMVILFRVYGSSGAVQNQGFIYSDDDGASWSGAHTPLIVKTGHRPYVQAAYDPVGDRIDLLYTDGHPRDVGNSLWHATFESNGDVRESDGTLIRNALTTGPIDWNEGTQVYTYSSSVGRVWGWNVCRDPSNNAVLHGVFGRYVADNEDHHRYGYARYDGSAWSVTTDITGATAGFTLYGEADAPEPHYSGGIHLNKRDPREVFLSRLKNSYAAEVLADEPAGYWRLGELAGTVAVDDRGTNDGAYVNTPTLGAAGALAGDPNTGVATAAAQSEDITLPGPVLSANGTIEFLFKWTAGTALFRDNTGTTPCWLAFDNAGTFALRIGEATTRNTSLSTAAVRDGNWHHFALVKTGASAQVYIDGVQVLTTAAAGSTAAAMPWHFGRNGTNTGAGNFSDATYDEIAVYSAALTPTRVAAHHAMRALTPAQWEIERWATLDNGATWALAEAITSGSGVKNVRPVAPARVTALTVAPPELVWMAGFYEGYQVSHGGYETAAVLVESPQPVDGPALDVLWDTRAAVDSPVEELVWDTRAQVDAAARTVLWDLVGQVNAAGRVLIWDLRGAVSAGPLFALWDLAGGPGPVNGPVDRLVWDLRAQIAGPVLDAVWDVRSTVNSPTERFVWDLRARADAAARQLVWDLGSAVAAARTLRWDLACAVDREVRLVWDVDTELVAPSLTSPYRVVRLDGRTRAERLDGHSETVPA